MLSSVSTILRLKEAVEQAVRRELHTINTRSLVPINYVYTSHLSVSGTFQGCPFGAVLCFALLKHSKPSIVTSGSTI